MIFVDISSIFNAIVASFGQFLCFNLPRFTSQHPKVSAVALRLQSTLGATFSPKRLQKSSPRCLLEPTFFQDPFSKCSGTRLWSILDRCGHMFGSMLCHFGVNLKALGMQIWRSLKLQVTKSNGHIFYDFGKAFGIDLCINFAGRQGPPRTSQEPAKNQARKRFPQHTALKITIRRMPSTANKRTSRNGTTTKGGGGGVTPHGVFNN